MPKTQLILELCDAITLTYAKDEPEPTTLEQRVSPSAIARLKLQRQRERASMEQPSSTMAPSMPRGALLTPLVVSRAASEKAMPKLEEFYENMGAEKAFSKHNSSMWKMCFKWDNTATVEICYTQRPDR